MCEARVYKTDNQCESKIMDDVYVLKKEDDKIYLLNIFGEQEIVKANIKKIDFIAHKVILE